jgi:hypothetical protein
MKLNKETAETLWTVGIVLGMIGFFIVMAILESK